MRPLPRLNDDEYDRLTAEILDRVNVHVPEWTNWREADPGVTLVELIAFLGESLLERGQPSPRALARLREVVGRLQAEGSVPCPDDEAPTRNRYFHGRVLSAADFEQEQSYHRDKHRRHNRLLHGVGIVRGLEATVEPTSSGGVAVVVAPGLALSPEGEELLLCEPRTEAVPSSGSPLYVTLSLCYRPNAMVASSGGEEGASEASRIEEVVGLGIVADPGPGQLTLARLQQDATGAWRIDDTFKPARLVA